ncbi:hypothetical protein GCM10009839_46680 [Catenulispora yoronensis]|uniref:Uncharacterized protein n=1 Tax=Catenulispora yoronensis TaxID=450799 RepID=A0ABN2ULD0_9ACTN
MPFDTDAYIRRLASAHGLTAKPGDTDHSELTDRAVRAELADIKRRTKTLHAWSAAVIAAHQSDETTADDTANCAPDPSRRGCRCHQRRPDRRPGCRCDPRR